MAEVTLTYPDEHRDRIIEAICTRFGYQATVDVDGEDVDNPQSPGSRPSPTRLKPLK